MEKNHVAGKKTFPKILKYQRELRGWSQAKLAEEIGATPNRISLWERGVALPGAYFREKLCSCLDMDAQRLGLLAVDDDETVDDEGFAGAIVGNDELGGATVDDEVNEYTTVATPDILDEADAAAPPLYQPYPTENRRYSLMANRRWYWASLLVLALLIVGGGALLSFYGGFASMLNRGQSNPYPPHTGRLVLNDPLRDQSSDVNWQEGINVQRANCVFKDGGYVVFQPVDGRFHACSAQKTDYTNFTYEVTMTIQQGEFGGIVFRSEDSIDLHYYIFRVHTDGSYWLYRFVDENIDDATPLDMGMASVFNKGFNKQNILSVVAQGSSLTLYINHHEVTSLKDAGYTHGQIGVLAGSLGPGPSQALFQNVKVWD